MHPANPHIDGYDFEALTGSHPDLAPFLRPNPDGAISLDFADPAAIKTLNRALLIHEYGVPDWDIPDGFLCPAIPGRFDYLLHLRDLIGERKDIRILDIGTGASLIYPVLGRSALGWRFVATDADPEALASAAAILERNPRLKSGIQLRFQEDTRRVLGGIVRRGDRFDAVMCNPPFHENEEQVRAATRRKWKNLGRDKALDAMRNFSGRSHELWCEGGETAFIRTTILESARFAAQIGWFTSLVAKTSHVAALRNAAMAAGATEVRIVDMAQGQKKSRFLAWRFG